MKEYKENDIPLEIDGLEVIQDIFLAKEMLTNGETIVRYEFGDSMQPFLTSGQFCKLVPLNENDTIEIGDCVFAEVENTLNTHMVWMKHRHEDGTFSYLITTSRGHIIGWTKKIIAKAYPIYHKVIPNHCAMNIHDWAYQSMTCSTYKFDGRTITPSLP